MTEIRVFITATDADVPSLGRLVDTVADGTLSQLVLTGVDDQGTEHTITLVRPPCDPYAHLHDPVEREWLTNLSPADVLRNAHRFYDFMRDSGVPVDSYTRELAFEKAAETLHIDYDLLYDAWVSQTPVSSGQKP